MRIEFNRAKRPSLGFLFFAAVIVWLISILIENAMWQRYISENKSDNSLIFVFTFLLCLFVLFLILICIQRKSNFSVIYILFAVSIVAIFISLLYWSSWESNIEKVSQDLSSNEFIFETTSDMTKSDYGKNSEVRAMCDGKWIQVRVAWPDDYENVSIGHRFKASGSYIKPNKEESGKWYHKNGILGLIKLQKVEETGNAKSASGLLAPFRDASFERISNISTQTSGVLAGILLGNKTLYSGTQVEQEFKSTGLAHLMAVSGTHLAVVCALANALLGAFPISRKKRALVAGVLIASYLVLTALSLSALRSCIMCIAGLGANVFKRKSSSLQALSICIIALILLEPSVAFSAAFQLSVLAVFGILLFGPLFASWLSCLFAGKFQNISEAISIGIAASLTTSPVSILLFQQFPLLSPISTCIVAPLVTYALAVGLIGLLIFVICAPAGSLLLSIASVCISLVLLLVNIFSKIPCSCIPLDSAAVHLVILFSAFLLGIYCFWPCPKINENAEAIKKPYKNIKWKLVTALCLFVPILIALFTGFAVFSSDGKAKIVMLDVGQGDSMLICDKDAAILIDVGEEDNLLKAALARCGITKLDAIIITHKDSDHSGSLSSLAGVVQVDNVFIHEDLLDYEGEKGILDAASWLTGSKGASGLSVGDVLKIGRFKLTLLAPAEGGESENEDSLVNLLEYDEDGDGKAESSALLTGDAESQALADVCEIVKHVDIVKVPHHGSKKAFSEEELVQLSPKIALISVGEDNRYGHPASNTVKALEACGARVYRTDIASDITISFAQSKLGVSLRHK